MVKYNKTKFNRDKYSLKYRFQKNQLQKYNVGKVLLDSNYSEKGLEVWVDSKCNMSSQMQYDSQKANIYYIKRCIESRKNEASLIIFWPSLLCSVLVLYFRKNIGREHLDKDKTWGLVEGLLDV